MDTKKKVALGMILLIIVIVSALGLGGNKIKTQEAITTDYEDRVAFKGLYFTQEFVLYNGNIDKSELKVKNGEKIPVGINIYKNLVSNEAGLLCTHLDGLENKYDINNVQNITRKDIDSIGKMDLIPGIKIINNSDWYIYAEVDKNNAFVKRGSYDLLIGDNYYPARIIKINNKESENFLLFKMKNDLNIINLHRNINGYIIKSRYSGYVVPKEALYSKNGTSGVLIKTHGYAEFRNADISFQNDEMAVIEPSEKGKKLQEYDNIIINSRGVQDGSKIN